MKHNVVRSMSYETQLFIAHIYNQPIRSKPRTIRKRIYKEFDPKAFREATIQAKNEGRFYEIQLTNDDCFACEVFLKESLV